MNSLAFRAGLPCLLLALAGGPAPAGGPPEVAVARPAAREVTDHEDFTGRAEAPVRVELRARVSGYLLRAPFQEGADVKQGDVLFEIDPRPYRAELDRAEAAVGLAEAHLKLAAANLKRAEAGLAARNVSREEYDKVVAERAEAEAGLRAAKAGQEVARLNLDFTRVVAPVSGQVGRRLIDPGNVVKADETNLAVLITRDPVYVYFDIDERTYLRLRRLPAAGKPGADKLPVGVGLADEERFPRRGVVEFADNQVDPQTGTIRLRAVLPNKDRLLAPGMFVRVRLPLGEPHKALLVPERAVMTEGGSRFVYVVNDKDVIEKRPVQPGQAQDGRREVTEGLKPEDRVVVGRPDGLRPGMTVRPRPEAEGEGEKGKEGEGEKKEGGKPDAIAPASSETGPGILVQAAYAGASAEVVSDTVRAPIEQQVSAMENLRYMRSRCTNDGKYALDLTFGRGVDLRRAHLLVWNRVNVAVPQLPEAVQKTGVTVKHGTSGVLMVVNLSSPEGRYDELYLGNYANIQIKDELARLEGVGEVTLLGAGDYGLRVWLDAGKLAALSLNAGDVVRALENQNLQPALGRPQTEIAVKSAGRPLDPEGLGGIVLKADGEGRVVHLRDVARVEFGAGRRSQASLDGKPVAALVVYPTGEVRPQNLRAAVLDRLATLRGRLPGGLDLGVTFDFTANREAADRPTTPEYLLIDLDFPAGASAERVERGLSRCEAALRQSPGVRHVLALSENPFDLFGGGPCALALLTPAQERKSGRNEVIRAVRTRLGEVKEVAARVRDLSGPGRFPRCGYPIDLAVSGPELDRVREWAEKLGVQLGRAGKLTDLRVNPDSAPRPGWYVDVDRKAAADRGVPVEEVFETLRVYAGPLPVGDFQKFGRAWRVEVRSEAGSDDWAKGVTKLQVRNARGLMIPLGAFVSVRRTESPLALDFLDLRPMVELTANPAAGVTAEQGRKLCETLAEEVRKELRLPADYRLTWLHEMAGPE